VAGIFAKGYTAEVEGNMPVHGLAAAGRHVPVAKGRERAAERIGAQ
jgi:hypothetical protein